MAASNVVFLVDVDRPAAEPGDARRWVLRVLLHLAGKHGAEKLRWGYKFFNSRTARSASLISKGSDLKELRDKTFQDFEAEFNAKLDPNNRTGCGRQRLKSTPAVSVQNAAKEALLDFQWDRPDITSPTKPTLRSRLPSRAGRSAVSHDDGLLSVGRNALFVLSQCPRSKAEMEDFLALSEGALPEHFLPKGLQEMLVQRRVVLHWVDTSCEATTAGDRVGAEMVTEALRLVCGSVVPLGMLHTPCHAGSETQGAFPLDSGIGYVLSSEKAHGFAFPPNRGLLHWDQGVGAQSCSVSLEPVACQQHLLAGPVTIFLTGVLQDWDPSSLAWSSGFWVLQSPAGSGPDHCAFLHLLKGLSSRRLHLLAEVTTGALTCSAVFSPQSPLTALLAVLQPPSPESSEVLTCDLIGPASEDEPCDLPEVVSSVLSVVYDTMEDEDHGYDKGNNYQVPDWAQQEVNYRSSSAVSAFVECWFPQSDESGVSSHLMESMRLLHAAQEKVEEEQGEELSASQLELFSDLSELYQASSSQASGVKSKKRGAQRTPVRQKMKTMCRSLQMLNAARLNVKAQKGQADSDPPVASREPEKTGKRCSGERSKTGSNIMHFKSEEELISHLKISYQRALSERDSSLLTVVRNLFNVVNTFITSTNSSKVQPAGLIGINLLKSSKSVRQFYGNSPDAENKVRECQLQAVLRLEIVQWLPSDQRNTDSVEQMVEEVADMLRMISLTKDPVYLTKFMQDEVLPPYITNIPRVLADVYHSLGTQLPDSLVAVLPSDFFSDESVAKDSVASSPISVSGTQHQGSEGLLVELRNRSTRKRRSGMLTRHRSMTEAPQALRQIEMPRKSGRVTKPSQSSQAPLPPQKQQVQEVTKVRRNLFNQDSLSPAKKSKMPRSQSVSAVDILKKRKHSQMTDDKVHPALLTKKVAETPLHKQVSSRLLHRQMMGRASGPTDVSIVEESPVKPSEDLRRSPRIKNLARRHSSVFYSSSQPRSRNLDRALSSSQLLRSEGRNGGRSFSEVKSPMRLLFGAAKSPGRPSTSSGPTRGKSSRRLLLDSTESNVFESPENTPKKQSHQTPTKSLSRLSQSVLGNKTPRTPQGASRNSVSPDSKDLETITDENRMTLRGSPFRSPVRSLVQVTPRKNSPLKGILRTPAKTHLNDAPPAAALILQSPNTRTPKKSVTWSPSPRTLRSEGSNAPFKIPESPSSTRMVPKLLTPGKLFSPESKSKTLEKPTDRMHQRSGRALRSLSFCGQDFKNSMQQSDDMVSPAHSSPTTPESPGPFHAMLTRSGRTPVKDSPLRSPRKAMSPPVQEPVQSEQGTYSGSDCGQTDQMKHYNLRKSPVQQRMARHTQPKTRESPVKFDASNKFQEVVEISSSDSQTLDSSQISGATTEDSIDITDASVVKTQLTDGLKMNISFTRKPSKSSEVFKFTASPKTYGFRRTPDRQQREAAARLGYSAAPPKFSTPRASSRRKLPATPNALTYQVELEMQASGIPKLKFKRTDSFDARDAIGDGPAKICTPGVLAARASRLDGPLVPCTKRRDAAGVSPSICSHGTPAKGTPGKGSIQTYICQSYTPTRTPAGTPSPVGAGEVTPWTPSPSCRGLSTPESLDKWPRKKRARMEAVINKEKGITEELLLEDPELEEMFRLKDTEVQEPSVGKSGQRLRSRGRARNVFSKTKGLDQIEDMDWTDSLVQQFNNNEALCQEDAPWLPGTDSASSVVTPPSTKAKNPVSASSILALTQSPLLYKAQAASASKAPTQFKGEESATNDEVEADHSPFGQPRRRRRHASGRIYSRKRLLV
ncbi:treslin [Denticeps clupeoides]|uniref:treslin n=1 Tax=Denticeps clupeoides TaxID=299321 RepID=UPI0010A5896B|nr:treslin [Denticeps clupeoides]